MKTILLGVFCLGIWIAVANQCADSSTTAAAPPPKIALTVEQKAAEAKRRKAEIAARANNLMAVIGVRKLKESMRDPDSFKLVSAIITPRAVCYTYRARNGFGGMNLDAAVLQLGDGRIITDKGELGPPAGAWHRFCAGHSGTELAAEISTQLAN